MSLNGRFLQGRFAFSFQYSVLPDYYKFIVITVVILITLIEAIRLYLGCMGNLQEKVSSSLPFRATIKRVKVTVPVGRASEMKRNDRVKYLNIINVMTGKLPVLKIFGQH